MPIAWTVWQVRPGAKDGKAFGPMGYATAEALETLLLNANRDDPKTEVFIVKDRRPLDEEVLSRARARRSRRRRM